MRLQLEDQLRALGPAPRRLAPVTPAHRAEALTHAAQREAITTHILQVWMGHCSCCPCRETQLWKCLLAEDLCTVDKLARHVYVGLTSTILLGVLVP